MKGASLRVSVVVPAFNAEHSIDAALESVFAQTFRDFEVVVVDDGSTDGTANRLARWSERVTVLSQPNGGPARARNAAISASSGDLIAFLDADDTWLPEKLARQVDYFDRHPETGLLHTAAITSGDTMPPRVSDAPAAPRRVFCELFHTDLDINTLTVMVRRDVLANVGLFDERREIHVEDWDLWLRVAARYPVGYLADATAVRRLGGGMSSAVEKTFRGQAAVIEKTIPLCRSACPLHSGQAKACLDRRWHRFHWEHGYARLREGNTAGARSAFLEALRYRPLDRATYVQLAASFSGETLRAVARRLRRKAPAAPTPRRSMERANADALSHGVHASSTQARNETMDPFDASGRAPAEGEERRHVSLVHDTLYRRTRHALAERLHDLDDLVSRHGGTRRVLFQAASPMSFVIFRPVYEKLRHDARLEFWFTSAGSTWDAFQLYEVFGMRDHIVPTAKATWMKVDACINADFWDTTWLRRRTRRVHLFHGVAGKYGLDAPIDLAPIITAYDRLLFPNDDRLQRYAEAGLVDAGGPRAVLTGYPKVDPLVDGSIDADRIMTGLSLDRRRPTVIYAPTWSPYSSLNACGESIISRLSDAGFNVIVKLHDRSYDLNPRGSGGINWVERLEIYRDHPRVRVVLDADSTPYLAVSDAMVTDHSSVGFEFALLDRPIVVLDCPDLLDKARVTRSKALQLRAAAEVVASASQVPEAVERQLEAPCLHKNERLELAKRFFYRPGTAALRAASVVYEVLGLEAPDAMTATPPGMVRPAVAQLSR